MSYYEFYKDYFNEKIVNIENLEKIKELNMLLNNHIIELRELINNNEYVKAVELYIQTIIPLNKDLLFRKYNISDRISLKNQKPQYNKILENYELVINEKVIKFVV